MLKRLELIGFKSFADRTRFDFGPGVTAIVGPNGSGKSNVVDAVRWILGEQSARSLRGSQMADVIFNGSASRRSQGMAEVTIVFDNQRRFLPVEREEVAVTRRVYRSGEGEYLINGQSARLRDIREMFLGTGASLGAYSIIEQGRVDQILQSSPVERRALFEEAAGIAKLRVQKAETARRLERVGQNLLRIQDIHEELEKQLRGLRSQAGKARKYAEYADRLKRLRIFIGRHDLTRFDRRLDELAGSHAERQSECADLESRLESDRATLDAAERELAQWELDYSRRRDAVAAVRQEMALRQSELSTGSIRLGEIERMAFETTSQLSVARRSTAELTRHHGDLENQIAHLQSERERMAADAEQGQTLLAQAAEEVARLNADLEQNQAESVSRIGSLAKLENNHEAAEAQLEQLCGRRDRLGDESRTARDAGLRLRLECANIQARLGGLNEQIARITLLCEESTQAAIAAAEKLELAQQRESELRHRRAGLVERSRLLDSLCRRREGLDAGVVEALRRRDEGDPHFASLVGVLAEAIAAPPELAELVELALGPYSQALLIDASAPLGDAMVQAARELPGRVLLAPIHARTLHETGAGDSEGLLPPDEDASAPAESPGIDCRLLPPDADFAIEIEERSAIAADLPMVVLPEEFDCPRLASLIDCPEKLRPLVDRLLDGVFVAADLKEAREWLLRLCPPTAAGRHTARSITGPIRLAARTGELLEADGSLFVGSGEGATSGVVARRAELAAVQADLAALEMDARAAENQSRDAARNLELANQQLRQLQSARAVMLEQHTAFDREFRELDRAACERFELSRQADAARSELSRRIAEDAEAADRLADEIARTHDRVRNANAVLESIRQRLSDAQQRKDELSSQATARRVELATVDERLRAALEDRQRTTRQLEELADRIEFEMQREKEMRSAKAAMEQRLLAAAAEFAELAAKRDAIGSIHAAEAALEEARRRRKLAQARIDAVKSRLDVLKEARHAEEMESTELRLERQTLLTRIREEYGIDLTAAESVEWPTQTEAFVDEGDLGNATSTAVAARPPGDPGAPASELEATLESARSDADGLREKIARLGAVNLEAMTELDAVEGRAAALRAQLADLAAAERLLRQVLAEVNEKARRRFLDVFDAVRGHFRDLFRRIFGGGQADVVLEDESDPLESGIEIVARPPGKEPASISQLSGGEKTLAAAALLLSLFKSNPSPFCILDEVDAALDEANIGRFVSLVREFASGSVADAGLEKPAQFILVTHSKTTMAAADCLHGVTQRESGVSLRVSVRLEDVDDGGRIADTALAN